MDFITEKGDEYDLKNLTDYGKYLQAQNKSIEVDPNDDDFDMKMEEVEKRVQTQMQKADIRERTAQNWAKQMMRTNTGFNTFEKKQI
ncbi:hypothetical protein BDF20DRAFT_914006 [Mycotypha africana]|uniref:uncharacterized protein n=1 Tax=Mycotypha africana TaxID=64632 RepID=UPI00230136A9|nr:uncharacterized protein BDF20DRAFT_914006 [Mycotypha africana]KAI8977699.1 hypothetical protein BDF20DRAFT_914006 [Mycotypha africana]